MATHKPYRTSFSLGFRSSVSVLLWEFMCMSFTALAYVLKRAPSIEAGWCEVKKRPYSDGESLRGRFRVNFRSANVPVTFEAVLSESDITYTRTILPGSSFG